MKRLVVVIALGLALVLVAPTAASAYTFTRSLKEGDKGSDVKALKIRLAGWFPRADQTHLVLDGRFGSTTTETVKAFQSFYGLSPDGIAGPAVYAVIDGLEDDDGSTLHFTWREFKQKANSNCSARANNYAGTFKGGMVAPLKTRKNIKKIMWRLEALRAKGGDKPIGINSAYRSVAYNDCIGGARLSQHMYGTAADNRMAETHNQVERDLAKGSQFHGIGCYSAMSHNHFDIRLDNKDSNTTYWWWPKRDAKGRDLADDGAPCWGEKTTDGKTTSSATAMGGSAPIMPSRSFVEWFSSEPEFYGGLAD